MNHFKKIAGVLEAHGLDAVLLTCEANRFYASGFHSSGTDGVAIVTRNRSYYFTDSRYTEAAARYVQGAEIRQTDREHPYSALINEVIEKEHITRMGYEDEYMTAADFRRFSEKLHCELVPATAFVDAAGRQGPGGVGVYDPGSADRGKSAGGHSRRDPSRRYGKGNCRTAAL